MRKYPSESAPSVSRTRLTPHAFPSPFPARRSLWLNPTCLSAHLPVHPASLSLCTLCLFVVAKSACLPVLPACHPGFPLCPLWFPALCGFRAQKKPLTADAIRGLKFRQRATLPRANPAVPSPMRLFTSVFGMGTGVASSLWPPKKQSNESG